MYVFKSDVLDKQLNSNKNRVDIKNRLNKIIEKLYKYNSLEDLQKDKNLGFKKYKGLSNNVYGIDIGRPDSSSMTGERLIITIENNFDEKNKILFKNIDGDKSKLSILLQYYCKHDEQNKKVKEKDISQDNNDFVLIQNLSDELKEKDIELLKDGIDLKTKFQQIRSGNYDKSNAVLTIDKYDIIDRFIYNSNSIILNGIAGSGKTEILIRIIHEIYINSPNSKVLYITMSDNLSYEANKKYDFYDNNINVDFHSMKSLIRKNSNQNYEFENIKTFNSFIEYYRYETKKIDYNLKNKIIKFLDNNNIYSIYSEIYGVIFGNMLDNWNRKSNIITFDEYEKLPNDYKNFNDNLFEMYEICKLYLNYLSDNNIKSYNVECMNLINSKKYDKYDYVLIDEIQDLTECQINLLIEMCNDKNHLLLCGDIKQIINPTFFEFGRIKSKLKKENVHYESLRSNFRNSKNISKLINKFNEIRKDKLYSLHQEDSQDEQSKNTSPGSIYLYQGDKKELIEYFSSASDAIIVDEKEMEKIKNLNVANFNIFTSSESKGLEFENVCVINMLSDNKNIFDKIWSSNYKIKDKTLHYNFNLFYVAITRTKTNLVIVEEKQLDLFDNLINSINEIEVVNDVSDIDKQGDKTAIAYYNQALAIFEKKQYNRALKYFEKAKIAENFNDIDVDEIDKMILVCDIYNNFNLDSDLAYNFEKNKIYDYAYKHYKEINNNKKMALMLLMEEELNSFSNLIVKNNIDIIELYNEEKDYQLYIEKYFDKLNNSTNEIINGMSNYIDELSNMIDGIRIGEEK